MGSRAGKYPAAVVADPGSGGATVAAAPPGHPVLRRDDTEKYPAAASPSPQCFN
jgi:hypothetical protein